MAYASKSGRARTSPTSPEAYAVCQRCSLWYNRRALKNQHEWRGAALLPLYIYVCDTCLDVPQQQLRALTLPADPIPVRLALPEPFLQDESTYMSLANYTIDPTTGIPIPDPTTMGTEGGDSMTPVPYGQPVGLIQNAVMPQQIVNGVVTSFGDVLPVLSVTSDGSPVVVVTCSAPHGLATLDQVSIVSLTNAQACGFYSVTVTTATAFTYQTYSPMPAAALITGSTRIITCLIGLPLGYDTIQQVGR